MKRILVALMLLASASAFAQTAIVVHNTTSCTIYYQLVLTAPNGSGCPTSPTISDVFAILPNTYQDYKGTGVIQPYNLANYDFLGARIYKENNACSTSYNSVGISCTGFPLNFGMAVYNSTATCSSTFCSNITAVWTPSAGGTSRLTFY